MSSRSVSRATITACMAAGFTVPVLAGSFAEQIGYNALVERLGASTPTGAGISTAQVEVPDAQDDYGPNLNSPEFVGKTFIERSGPTGASSHATGVGRRQYGLDTSIAPDINTINLYEAGNWIGSGYLRAGYPGSSNPQLTPPGIKTINNSWVASIDILIDNDALRRADFVVDRDGVIITAGVNNETNGDNVALMSHMFNAIVVGRADGQHVSATTLATHDGPGRMKPEIVVPETVTSNAAPVISAAACLLVETARVTTGLGPSDETERPELVKALLLASATKENAVTGTWSNDPATSGDDRGLTTTPIDEIMGVGTLQIDRAHQLLTAGEQTGSVNPPGSSNIEPLGWELATINPGRSRYWRLSVPQAASEVSILATWNRVVAAQFAGFSLADFDIILHRVNGAGQAESLVGEAGATYYAGGNVASASAVDNIELVRVVGLEPGTYIIELKRLDAFSNAQDVAVAWQFPELSADFDGDGQIGFGDLTVLLGAWGPCSSDDCEADLDRDGQVGFGDLTLLLARWGDVS